MRHSRSFALALVLALPALAQEPEATVELEAAFGTIVSSTCHFMEHHPAIAERFNAGPKTPRAAYPVDALRTLGRHRIPARDARGQRGRLAERYRCPVDFQVVDVEGKMYAQAEANKPQPYHTTLLEGLK